MSFLDYKLWLEIRPTDNTLALQPLPTAPVLYQPPPKNAWDTSGYQQPYNPAATPTAIVQTRGAPLYTMSLSGYAVRATYDITPPQLVSMFGQQPVPFNDQTCYFRCGVVANWGAPIVAAKWKFRYVLAAPPLDPIVSPPNPILGDTAAGLAETGLGSFITSEG